jgi:uncharacterized protein YuzE
MSRVAVSYDRGSDVLYLTLHRARAAHGVEENGIVWRYAADGTLLGITIMDLEDRWGSKKDALADVISLKIGKMGVPYSEIRTALDVGPTNLER